jgi:hypothetical protein
VSLPRVLYLPYCCYRLQVISGSMGVVSNGIKATKNVVNKYNSFRSPSLSYLLVHSRCRGFLFSLDHTQAHHGRYDSSGRGIGPSQRPLPENTNTVQETNIHAPSGIRTHNPSKGSVADLRLRRRGHWDRPGRLTLG